MNSNLRGVRKFAFDDETGEITVYSVNEETGEPVVANISPPLHSRYNSNPEQSSEPQGKYIQFPSGYISKTKKFQSLKANILAGSNQISHRMLLIPAAMVFPALFTVILTVLEVVLHVYSHKKNRLLKDPNLYYRSPFHVITSIFCGVCRDCDTASKISQIQDKRRDRYDYIRSFAL